MTEGYLPGVPAVLALDPGITTGWAVVAEGAVVGTGVFAIDELESGLDTVVRGMHRAGYALTVVVEEMPPGRLSHLSVQLEKVRRVLTTILEQTFELTINYVLPGEWKPSRIARKTRLPKEFGGKPLLTHQRDAIKMALYFIEKGEPR